MTISRAGSVAIAIPCVGATVTGDDDVTVLQANARVLARTEVGVTAVAGRACERTGQVEAVALGDASDSPDVSACAVLVARSGGLSRAVVEALDSLPCDGRCAHGVPEFRTPATYPFRSASRVAARRSSRQFEIATH
jgi:hypothetical protein